MNTETAGWSGILDDGETILWQGRPSSRFRLTLADLKPARQGLMMTLFSVVWLSMAMRAPGIFWLFGLPFLLMGLWQIAKPLLLPALLRQYSFYTLTDRRAFIATDAPLLGRNLRSFPITADTRLDFLEGEPGSILFADDRLAGLTMPGPDGIRRVGFQMIPDARKVYGLMRQIQTKELTR